MGNYPCYIGIIISHEVRIPIEQQVYIMECQPRVFNVAHLVICVFFNV